MENRFFAISTVMNILECTRNIEYKLIDYTLVYECSKVLDWRVKSALFRVQCLITYHFVIIYFINGSKICIDTNDSWRKVNISA